MTTRLQRKPTTPGERRLRYERIPAAVCFHCGTRGSMVGPDHVVCHSCHARNGRCQVCGYVREEATRR